MRDILAVHARRNSDLSSVIQSFTELKMCDNHVICMTFGVSGDACSVCTQCVCLCVILPVDPCISSLFIPLFLPQLVLLWVPVNPAQRVPLLTGIILGFTSLMECSWWENALWRIDRPPSLHLYGQALRMNLTGLLSALYTIIVCFLIVDILSHLPSWNQFKCTSAYCRVMLALPMFCLCRCVVYVFALHDCILGALETLTPIFCFTAVSLSFSEETL